MKRTTQFLMLLMGLLLAPLAPVWAQGEMPADDNQADTASTDQPTALLDSMPQRKAGFFGSAFGGVSLGFMSDLEDDLKSDMTFANDDFTINPTATHLGAQVNGLLFKKLIVGGHLSYFDFDASLSEEDSPSDSTTLNNQVEGLSSGLATLESLTFGGRVGYAVITKPNLFLYPYAGFTIGTTDLTVENRSQEDIEFGDQVIEPARNGEFEADLAMVEAGVSFRYHLKTNGSLMLGADLGGYFSIGDNDWEVMDEGTVVNGVETNSMAGAYLRFTLGGAFFKMDPPMNPIEEEPASMESGDGADTEEGAF